jgi:hypothetical protein
LNPTWIYVGALYALAVWLARRRGTPLPPRIALFFYALVLVFFFRPLTTDTINVPVDYYSGLSPWIEVRPRPPHPRSSNPYLNDVALQMVPWAHEVREQWKSGRIPLWNETAASGMPLLANSQSGALSLLRLLALPLDLGHAMAAEGAWKVLIALTFTFLYCRRRYGELASAVAAVSFAFGAFMIVWLHYPHTTVAAFLPAALYAVDLLAERVTYARFVFAAAVWGVMLTGGHPETASHIAFFTVLAIVWIAFVEKAPRRFLPAALGSIVTGALLASPLIIPFLEAVTKSLRYFLLKSAGPPQKMLADWASTIGMLQPHFFGVIPMEEVWGPAGPEILTGFVGSLGVVGGMATALSVVRGRRWRSREAFFVLATVVAIGIVYFWPGIVDAFNLLFKFAANARVRLLIAFFLSVQVAAMLDRITERVTILMAILLTAALYLVMLRFPFPTPSERWGAVYALLPSVAVLMVATFAVLRNRRALLLGLFAVAIGEVWNVTWAWNPVLPASAMYPSTPMVRELIRLKERNPPSTFRMVGYGAELFPNLPTMYGLEDIRAHDVMAPFRYMGLLQVVTRTYNAGEYFAMWTDLNTRLLDYLNVKYYAMSPREHIDDPRFSVVYEARDGHIYENHAVLSRFFPVRNVVLEFNEKAWIEKLARHEDWAHTAILDRLPVDNDQMRSDLLAPRSLDAREATTTITLSAPTHYRIRADAPRYTLVVSSIPWSPGWKVAANGKSLRVIRVNAAFVGFVVPAGVSEIDVRYSPASFWAGLALSLATIAALIAWRLSYHRRGR